MEYLNLIATIATAIAAAFIAYKANAISTASLHLEADKLLIEWAQRAAMTMSRCVSLRLQQPDEMTDKDFTQIRRGLRAEIYALIAEGQILLRGKGEKLSSPCLDELRNFGACLKGTTFAPPRDGDWEASRNPRAGELRKHLQKFTTAIQGLISNEWLHSS